MPLRETVNSSDIFDGFSRSSMLQGLPLIIAEMLFISSVPGENSKALSLSGRSLVRTSGGLLKEGSAYVTLQRMQKRGLLSSRREFPPHDGASVIVNRLYTLTPFGIASLLRSQTFEKDKKEEKSARDSSK